MDGINDTSRSYGAGGCLRPGKLAGLGASTLNKNKADEFIPIGDMSCPIDRMWVFNLKTNKVELVIVAPVSVESSDQSEDVGHVCRIEDESSCAGGGTSHDDVHSDRQSQDGESDHAISDPYEREGWHCDRSPAVDASGATHHEAGSELVGIEPNPGEETHPTDVSAPNVVVNTPVTPVRNDGTLDPNVHVVRQVPPVQDPDALQAHVASPPPAYVPHDMLPPDPDEIPAEIPARNPAIHGPHFNVWQPPQDDAHPARGERPQRGRGRGGRGRGGPRAPAGMPRGARHQNMVAQALADMMAQVPAPIALAPAPPTPAEQLEGMRVAQDIANFNVSAMNRNRLFANFSHRTHFELIRPCPASFRYLSFFVSGGVASGAVACVQRLVRRVWRSHVNLHGVFDRYVKTYIDETPRLILDELVYFRYRRMAIPTPKIVLSRVWNGISPFIAKWGVVLMSGLFVGFVTQRLTQLSFRHKTVVDIGAIVGVAGPEDNRGVGTTTYISEYINGSAVPAINAVTYSDVIEYCSPTSDFSDGHVELDAHSSWIPRTVGNLAQIVDRTHFYVGGRHLNFEVNMPVVAELVLRVGAVTTDVLARCNERVRRLPSVNRQPELSAETRAALIASIIIESINQTMTEVISDPFCIQGSTGAFENLSH